MPPEWPDLEFLRHVFDDTRVVRKPVTGIIAGYHVLPYVLVGPEPGRSGRAVEVRGRIRVSPRLVIRPRGDGMTYGEVFRDTDLMDHTLVARLFSFRYASRLSLESEELTIQRRERDVSQQLEQILDGLARQEIINTGVIVSPDVRFYPVSIDRFIREILEHEFQE